MLKIFHKIDKLHIFLALCFVFIVSIAAVPEGPTRFNSLFVILDPDSATPDYALGDNDAYIKADFEVDGTVYFANVTRDIDFNMAGWVVDGGADVDEDSTPRLITTDNVPAIVWANSTFTSNIHQTFRLPSDYSTSMVFYAIMSSDTNGTGGNLGLKWRIWVNSEAVFDTTPVEQIGVTSTGNPHNSHKTSNEVMTLTVNSTGLAELDAGDWVTIEIQNETSHATANFELKGFNGTYTAAR